MTSVPETDEFKADTKMVKSPPHIFDNKLFDQWPEIEQDKLDLNKSNKNDKNNEEKISPSSNTGTSFDFEVIESTTYSMYVFYIISDSNLP